MTEMDESRERDLALVSSIHGLALKWLLDEALPLWDQHGVDRRLGGYFEDLSLDPRGAVAASGNVRRGRVVARQIYVFDVGHQFGWRSSISNPLEHGCNYLFSRLHYGDGRFHTSVDSITHVARAPFSLYEHAFYLFALARLHTKADRYPVEASAVQCLRWLRNNVGRADGGFDESMPPSLPLKSNPHMHLLEAAIVWVGVTTGERQQPWIALAEELVSLCLSRFRDICTGGIREYFTFGWRQARGNDGRIMEPGHQFEWAWLLVEWSQLPCIDAARRSACVGAAAELVGIGERGVDVARNIVINEIWDDMTPKDSAAKLWPQTERIKAWCAMLSQSRTKGEFSWACAQIVAATRGMLGYLRAEAPGMWHEVCRSDGQFAPGPSKASSLYHIVCAIHVLGNAIAAQVVDNPLNQSHDDNR